MPNRLHTKADWIEDLLGVIQAPNMALTDQVRLALQSLTLQQVQALHELIVYCETH